MESLMTRERQTLRRGFTYLELLVVLMILAVLTAVIIPVYGDSVTALQARSARGDLVALMHFVQEQAVRESREFRLYIDARTRAYWVEGWVSGHGEDKAFEPIADRAFGGTRYFPESMTVGHVRARSDRGRRAQYIAFFPNGACDRASVQLVRENVEGGVTTIGTTGVLGGIEVTP